MIYVARPLWAFWLRFGSLFILLFSVWTARSLSPFLVKGERTNIQRPC